MNIVKSIFMIGILIIVASYLYSTQWIVINDQGPLTRINKYTGVVQQYKSIQPGVYGAPLAWKTS